MEVQELRTRRSLEGQSLGHGKVGAAVSSFKCIHWKIIKGYKWWSHLSLCITGRLWLISISMAQFIILLFWKC